MDANAEENIRKIWSNLNFPLVEGISIDRYIHWCLAEPGTLDEWEAHEAGRPAKKATLVAEHSTLALVVDTLALLYSLDAFLPKTPDDLALLYFEGLDDLECSTYLSICGYYRQASTTLRTGFEAILLLIYFQLLPKHFPDWLRGDYYAPSGIELANTISLKSSSMYDQIVELVRRLNKFVHLRGKENWNEIVQPNYEPDRFRRWADTWFLAVRCLLNCLDLYHPGIKHYLRQSPRLSEVFNSMAKRANLASPG